MAKSIEEKAVESLATALSDNRFRYHEFARLMTEQFPSIHKNFFTLTASYINYLAAYDRYGWYPNNTFEEAQMAGMLAHLLKSHIVGS